MTSVSEIEQAIKKLPRRDYIRLRGWIDDYDLENEAVEASSIIGDMLDDEED